MPWHGPAAFGNGDSRLRAKRLTTDLLNWLIGMKNIYITASTRTPLGAFQGGFSSLSAPQLGAVVIKSSLEKSTIKDTQVDEVYFGNVVSAGLGQAPARQAALQAGLSNSIPCTTVSKVCGSGMKAVMLAADSIQSGHINVAIAGGMESLAFSRWLGRCRNRPLYGVIRSKDRRPI